MPGPHPVLDDRRSGAEAPRFPTLLQWSPHACRAGWTHARVELRTGPRTGECQFVSLAGAPSWAVSDTDSGVTDGRRLGMPFEIPNCVQRVPASDAQCVSEASAGARILWNPGTRVLFALVCSTNWDSPPTGDLAG